MRQRLGRLLAFVLMICLAAGCAPAMAESIHTEVDNPALEAEVTLGYDGRITFGKAMPVRVTVRNGGEDLEGVLAVNTYVNKVKYDRYEREISVPAGGERTFILPVTVENQQNTFTAEILKDGEKLLAVNTSPEGIINPSALMVGVLSTRPRNLASMDINQENDVLYRYEYWQTVALTPETLPEEKELLDAFGIIVLDDVDPAGLTAKQQEALRAWIGRGHVLLVGGGRTAPQNLAFLGEETALRTEDFATSEGVMAALEKFLGQQTTEARPEIALSRLTGEEPLAADEDGTGLLWRETVGSGRIYIMAWEAGDPAINAEAMMHPFWQQIMITQDAALYRDLMNEGTATGARYLPDETVPLTVRNRMPAAVIVIAGCALAAAGIWLLLRKKGKTQWMWAVLPALALIAAGAAVLLSSSSDMNNPVATTAISIVQRADGTTNRYTGITAAAPGSGLRSFRMEGEELEPILYDDTYYGEEDGTVQEPAVLRAVHRKGTAAEIAVSTGTPWESVRLQAGRTEAEDTGRVEAEIWKEKDGFHGEIRNGLTYGLKEGAVICGYGFVKIPALAPGESAAFTLLSETAKDPTSPVFENGKIYLNASSSSYGVTGQMLYGESRLELDGQESTLSGMMTTAMDYLAGDDGSSGQSTVVFTYCAEPEKSLGAPVLVDGKETEARSETVLFSAEVRYMTIGKTGVVFHAPGMDRAVRCEIDAEGLPGADLPEDSSRKYYIYYELSELPTFRFHPEGMEQVDIQEMTIGMDEWYVKEVKSYVLDPETREWTEFRMNQPLENAARYLDADGNLYCQFRPVAAETYTSIPLPTVMIEGVLKQ